MTRSCHTGRQRVASRSPGRQSPGPTRSPVGRQWVASRSPVGRQVASAEPRAQRSPATSDKGSVVCWTWTGPEREPCPNHGLSGGTHNQPPLIMVLYTTFSAPDFEPPDPVLLYSTVEPLPSAGGFLGYKSRNSRQRLLSWSFPFSCALRLPGHQQAACARACAVSHASEERGGAP